jgi:hypothetical protein
VESIPPSPEIIGEFEVIEGFSWIGLLDSSVIVGSPGGLLDSRGIVDSSANSWFLGFLNILVARVLILVTKINEKYLCIDNLRDICSRNHTRVNP